MRHFSMHDARRIMRILLADTQPRVRFALRALLDHQPHIHIVGEARNANTLLTLVDETQPDLLLLDWDLPGLVELGSVMLLRQRCPNLYIVVLSGHDDARQSALDAGTNQFVSKTAPPEHLLAALDNLNSP